MKKAVRVSNFQSCYEGQVNTTLELKPKLKKKKTLEHLGSLPANITPAKGSTGSNGRKKFRAIRGLFSVQNIDPKLKSIDAVKKIRSVCAFL